MRTISRVGNQPVLIIMAKAPFMGRAKTRLARHIGPVATWRVNRALHQITFRAAGAGPNPTRHKREWQTLIAMTPRHALQTRFADVWPEGLARVPQWPGDLTDRLLAAAKNVSLHRSIAFIGTDCPDLTRAHLQEGFRGLRRNSLVVGPAEDGGFWFLALRSCARPHLPRILRNVRWSSRHTLHDIEANLPTHLPMARIATLRDLDEVEDYAAYRGSLARRAHKSGR